MLIVQRIADTAYNVKKVAGFPDQCPVLPPTMRQLGDIKTIEKKSYYLDILGIL
jgi:hypothetical protein